MNNIEKVGKVEILALLITIICNNIILNVPSIIIISSGTGSWINLIYLTIICLVFICIVCKLFKPFVNFDIVDVSEYLGGKPLKCIISILFICFFILFASLCLRYFTNILQNIYFNNTPLVFLILLFLIPTLICSKGGLKSILSTNLVFVPMAIFAIILLYITASSDFVVQRLFPVLGYGAKETFVNQISNLFGFNVIGYLFFIKPFLKQESDFKKISIFTVIVCGVYLLFSIFALLMAFSYITHTDENFSLYLLARLISFGRFFQRVDAIFVFVWILAILSFLSFNVFIITHIFKKLLNLKASSEYVYPVSAVLFSIALAIKDISILKFLAKDVTNIFITILIFVISFVVLIFAYIKKRKRS